MFLEVFLGVFVTMSPVVPFFVLVDFCLDGLQWPQSGGSYFSVAAFSDPTCR